MNKRTFQAIDFAKIFFCICIVSIHTGGVKHFFSEADYWYLDKMIFRLGVPFFFVVSGFFIGNKIYSRPEKLKQIVTSYTKRLLVPLVVFQAINIVLRVTLRLLEGSSPLRTLALAAQSVIFYPYGALWYIQASIIAMLLLYYFIKRNKMNQAIVIGSILYIVGLLANSYYFLIENTGFASAVDIYLKIAVSSRNGLFVGFLFLGLGIWLSQKIDTNQLIFLKVKSFIAFVVSFIIYGIEVTFVYGKNYADGADYYVMLPIVVASLLVYLLTLNLKRNTEISKLSRKLSTGIYYLHSPLIDTIKIIAIVISTQFSSFILFLLVLFIGTSVLLVVYKKKIEPLNRLLS